MNKRVLLPTASGYRPTIALFLFIIAFYSRYYDLLYKIHNLRADVKGRDNLDSWCKIINKERINSVLNEFDDDEGNGWVENENDIIESEIWTRINCRCVWICYWS